MTTTYLLPCSCGQKISVQRSQAGEEVRCNCGATAQVPTMLEMTALQTTEPQPGSQHPARTWGIGQGLVLIGVVIFLVASGLAAYLIVKRPEPQSLLPPPDAETIRRMTDEFSPVQSMYAWQVFRNGGLVRFTPTEDERYREGLFVWSLWMGAVLVIALTGAGLATVPLLTARQRTTGKS